MAETYVRTPDGFRIYLSPMPRHTYLLGADMMQFLGRLSFYSANAFLKLPEADRQFCLTSPWAMM